MRVVRTMQELEDARTANSRLALVPTMGALHDGHLSLIKEARRHADTVAVSIFVNPLQFAPTEDLSQYPRTEAEDLHKLEQVGCDLLWLPEATTMYPDKHCTTINVAGPALQWEGAARPGHFQGVATVVATLFGQIRPTCAIFGEKDWQQLQVIRQMVSDLHIPVTIIGAPTVREPDGLAMSSRNRFLTSTERAHAVIFSDIVRHVAWAIGSGDDASTVLASNLTALADNGFTTDYLAWVEADTLEPMTSINVQARSRIIAAVKLGSVRLLDNAPVIKQKSH